MGHWFPTSALVHGGRSSLFALGSPPGRFADRWEVALRNPFQPEAPLGVLRLRNRGLGTSGGAFQQFVVEGRCTAIIDPRTGEPAQGPASVTVLAPTAADAEPLDGLLSAGRRCRPGVRGGTSGGRHPHRVAGAADEGPRVLTFGLNSQDFLPDQNSVNSMMTW